MIKNEEDRSKGFSCLDTTRNFCIGCHGDQPGGLAEYDHQSITSHRKTIE